MFKILRTTGIKICGAIGLLFFATTIYADEHRHNPGEHNKVFTLNHGKQWEGDGVLRQGMDSIRQTMIASQDAIEKDHLSTQDYQRLAESVGKDVADIVKNCKLTKETDAAFHTIVLADLIQPRKSS